MSFHTEFAGIPTELAGKIDPDVFAGVTPKKEARQMMKSAGALSEAGITFTIRRSNGKRLIELHRVESAVSDAPLKTDPCGTEVLRQDGQTAIWTRRSKV